MEPVLTILFISLFVVLLNVFILRFLVLSQKRQRAYAEERLRLQADYEQELLRTQLEIREETLRYVGQELHDNVGQTLSLVKLNLYTLQDGNPPRPDEKIERSKTQLTKAMSDLRQLSRSLYGGSITDRGLREGLQQELDQLQQSGVFTTDLTVLGTPYRVDPQQELLLFRIAQEALHNAVKHAKKGALNIILQYKTNSLQMSIRDDGPGFDPDKLDMRTTGLGLKNMANRAALMGAQFAVEASPGKGCTIQVVLPTTDTHT
jgi:signal transduction histidine kinase